MEKYTKPQTAVEEFKTVDVITTSGSIVVKPDPSWDGEFDVNF